MNAHDHARRLVAIAVDGAIPGSERDDLDTHLRTCLDCRAFGVAVQGDAIALARLSDVDAPAWIRSSVVGAAADPRRRKVSWPTAAVRLLAAALALVVLLSATVLLVGSRQAVPVLPPPAPDRLSAIRALGRIELSVPTGSPLDAKVAQAIADRMGLSADLTLTPVGATTGTSWVPGTDASVGLIRTGTGAETTVFSDAYAYRAAVVQVPSGSTVRTIGDLAGAKVCVIRDSEPDYWLLGFMEAISATPVATRPTNTTLIYETSDDACVKDVLDGTARALVTDRWGAASSATAELRALADQAFVERITLGVERVGSDPTSLIGAFDQAVSELRSDGTLDRLGTETLGLPGIADPPPSALPSP